MPMPWATPCRFDSASLGFSGSGGSSGRGCRSPSEFADCGGVGLEPSHRRSLANPLRAGGSCRSAGRSAVRSAAEVFPPSARVDAVSIASSEPSDYGCTATRWSLDDIAATILNQAHAEAMSRSTIFRILDDADLKPHRSVYWLNSHDPDFQRKAREVCGLYVSAPRLYEQGRLLICTDEKTGMQILERKYPTKLAEPGKPERREQEYIRHGTLALTGSFVVPTGEVVWNVGQTRTSVDFAAHLKKVAEHFPNMRGFDWVLDNLNTHWSLEVCEVVASLSDVALDPKQLKRGEQRRAFLTDPSHKHLFHFTPKHGSWLNQVELWFSILSRRFSPTRRLLLSRSVRGPASAISRRLQRLPCTSVPLDLHGATVGPCYSFQCNAMPAETRPGLVRPASTVL